jgi:outer membrane protein TolC
MSLTQIEKISPDSCITHTETTPWCRLVGSKHHLLPYLILGLLWASPPVSSGEQSATTGGVLTLHQAEQLALDEEPGIISQQWQAKSLEERSVADGQLMDPKLQFGVANLPTDSFDFDQENMTQFKVGIVQQFPGGNTRALRQQKTLKQSDLLRSKIEDRKLMITKDVRLTYLEIYYWEQAKGTIIKNRKLFSQLVDIVQSMFSVGRNNQQDLIRAQLELSRLDDRTAKITQKINVQRSRLSRWVGAQTSHRPLFADLPALQVPAFEDDFQVLSHHFLTHPRIQEMDKKLEVSRKDIDLTKESYKPDWALSVSYGYRDDAPNRIERSDFISAAVTMDLPLFTANRQDRKLLSREHQFQALKDKRVELIRQLVAELKEQMANEEQLAKRHQLYVDLLLPQAKQQAEASLLAYQSDQGDFADVMRAHIDDLNASLDEQRISVDLQQARAKILYFISSFEQQADMGS